MIVVAMILPSALGSYLVFIKSGYNFAEHLVLNAFVVGQLIIADIILYCISVSPLADKWAGAAVFVNFILKIPYWLWAYW